ncbi:isoleucine--tRNA ligase [Nakamurella multipartita]|uniref:Isoleucine--tRNA ligase n=1 Tax=Nakamurella multipartita (strain ATCC 700099 / DSM 44233 / CIP 104796 / JCM 9543 / NBRC 105858 / Y-104) TaxID=479431 RepID=C8XG89_NAKMY|nr:isoleucine--tRNA ligase [Nakamurella multipartita]ACV80091.1 isoleucyl-tRNA synthetase [Nakamurella multipartita DSM 44233]
MASTADHPNAYPRAGATEVATHPDFPALERQVLAHWAADGTFQASIDRRAAGDNGSNEYVFYDGPPFANGLPHYGHLLTGYVKDVVPRYHTMRGRKVERRFGWDTHGLPAEVEAERQLGIKHKSEIVGMGIEAFNDACRQSVLRYTHEWQEYVTRQARWVDFENDYKTLDLDYMESVMWAFKTLWDKGLIYEGYRVLWYCIRCETPLSATETKMDDTYRSRQDPAVTVSLRLRSDDPALDGVNALVWTTTPWTLPSNLAAAVGPDIDYVVVESAGPFAGRYLLAQARLGAYARELGEEPAVLARYTGAQLVGVRYTPPFDFFVGRDNAHQVLTADYVSTEDGTGMVHIAPAFGEEDKAVTDAAGIEVVNPVDGQGRFTAQVPAYEGFQVFDANVPIIADLKAAGLLLRRDSYEHPYPHCWRCDTPLIQRAVSSWFVAVTQFRDRMVELNQQISWVPGHIKDGQFGKWLEGARDWSISRNRFWGSPIPVWTSDDPTYPRTDVYGSLDELERDFGVRPSDLHRPMVDELTRPNPDDPTGRSTMRRVPEVLDCWFESGSMPYAQVHYPFENREWFEDHYPGDFIVEYNGQTRGWFYTLHVLATALFDRPAFVTCMAHGIVLGDDGQKMSKSRRNYPDVGQVFERDGSDAMRWFLMSSPILRGADLVVTEQGIRDSVRQAVLPLWNAWSFLSLYANAGGVAGSIRTDSTDVLDRYILAKTAELTGEVTAAMDAYDLAGACAAVRVYLEVLTNWYIRRSRQRFWDADQDAIDTLHTVLETLCRVAAPLLPLTTEVIYRGLTGERSVHLTDWPADQLPLDAELVTVMDEVREVASVALSVRKAGKLRVRQPLSSMTVAVRDAAALEPFAALLADEVNVRSVLVSELAEHDERVTRRLTVNARAAGPRLGKQVQQVIKAAKSGDWSVAEDGTVTCGDVVLADGEYTLELSAAGASSDAVGLLSAGGFVALETTLDDDLVADGLVRDVARGVQDLRKSAGLDVSDRIELFVVSDDAIARSAVLGRWGWLADQVLAVNAATLEPAPADALGAADLVAGTGVDAAIRVQLRKAPSGS